MKMSQRLLHRWLQYSMDMILLLLLSVWAFAPFKENQYLEVIVLMIFGGIFYELLFRRITPTVGKVLLTLPIFVGIGWLVLGIDMLVLLAVTALIGWRFTSHYFNEDLAQETNLLMLSYVSCIAFYFLYSNNKVIPFVLLLVLIQTMMFAVIRVKRYMHLNTDKTVNRWIVKFSLGILGVTALIVAIFPLIESAVMLLMKAFAAAFAIVVYYPLSFVFGIFESFANEKSVKDEAEDVEVSLEENEEKLKEMIHENNPNEWFTYALLILLAIGLIWFGIKLYRRKLMSMNQFAFGNMSEKSEMFEEDFQNQYLDRKVKVPENKIRKQLFRLEKKMSGYSFGRRSYEPVLEWMDRLDAPDELSVEVNRIYQRVRYGEEKVTSEEERRYVQSINELLKWAKEQSLIKKKKQKRKDRLDT
jgi:hypothetical protein